MERKITDPLKRFWSKVKKSDECWEWTCTLSSAGYGVFQYSAGTQVKAYRLAYELLVGPIPKGMVIDHRCRNRKCVNPDHLRAVTQKQNMENRANTGHGKSGIRGVYTKRKGWRAEVSHHGKTIHVGHFKTVEEAERAVIAKRLELHTHNENDRNQAAREAVFSCPETQGEQ